MDSKSNFSDLNNSIILITGGTGSFGNAVVGKLLEYYPKRIIIYSRDEKKQFDMGNTYRTDTLRFVIGDVRDKDRIFDAMRGVDFVFHAAALKQVPHCEFFPVEATQTNAIGAQNVIRAAIYNSVKRVVVLSTDKAVYPINVMGMTKALMERMMIAVSREETHKTVLCGTRYGNVMYTRGSVIPYFISLMREGRPLTVTDNRMTRFMVSLDHAVDLILHTLLYGSNGDIYVRKMPAATMQDVACALVKIFHYSGGITEAGIRPGEKLHETLISQEELLRTEDRGEYLCIKPEVPHMDYRSYYMNEQAGSNVLHDSYTSANAVRLSFEETKALLLSLPQIQEELRIWSM